MTNAPAEEDGDAPTQRGPLRSREVFLDTEVYRRLGFDPKHPSLVSMRDHVKEDRLALHLTDITIREVERQSSQQARDAMEEVGRAHATLAKWQARAPSALGTSTSRTPIDADQVARESLKNFVAELHPFTLHKATQRSGSEIFKAYFDRRAPFDGKSAKEFPDAFVIEELDAWCIEHKTRMYVVTADQAMRRASSATSTLIPLATLDELLEAATIEHSPDVLQTVKAIVDQYAFADRLTGVVDNAIHWAGITYIGDLNRGEAESAERTSDPVITDWSVISAGDGSFGLIVEVMVNLLVQVHFQDLSMATYDHEDGRYYNAEPSDTRVSEDGVTVRVFVEVSEDGTITREEPLDNDIEVYGDVYWWE